MDLINTYEKILYQNICSNNYKNLLYKFNWFCLIVGKNVRWNNNQINLVSTAFTYWNKSSKPLWIALKMLQMSDSQVIFSPLTRTLPGLWLFHSENSGEAHEIHDRVTEKLALTNFAVSKVCRRERLCILTLIVFEPYGVCTLTLVWSNSVSRIEYSMLRPSVMILGLNPQTTLQREI